MVYYYLKGTDWHHVGDDGGQAFMSAKKHGSSLVVGVTRTDGDAEIWVRKGERWEVGSKQDLGDYELPKM